MRILALTDMITWPFAPLPHHRTTPVGFTASRRRRCASCSTRRARNRLRSFSLTKSTRCVRRATPSKIRYCIDFAIFVGLFRILWPVQYACGCSGFVTIISLVPFTVLCSSSVVIAIESPIFVSIRNPSLCTDQSISASPYLPLCTDQSISLL